MKILIISHEFPPVGGGGANACQFLSNAFAKLGHEITILTSDCAGIASDYDNVSVTLERLNTNRKRVEHSSFKDMFVFMYKAFLRSNDLLKNNKFDICMVFFGIPSGPIGWFLKKKYGLPYVIRMGGGDIPGYQKRFDFIYKVLSPFIKMIWDNADALVANSMGLRELAYSFSSKNQIDIINNGVDVKLFSPKESKSDGDIQILFVSRLIERKGLQFLIPVIHRIEMETSRNLKLVVVGDGPFRLELEKLCQEFDMMDKIIFAGQKNKSELISYYQNSDIFVLPSEKEGMPNVVLEAMACGLPIIMTNCQGSAELIGDNGIVCEQTSESLRKAFVNMINSNKMLEMGKQSRKKVEEEFEWSIMAEQYLSIFNSII